MQEAKTPYESLMEVWRVKKVYRLPCQQSTPLSFLPASGIHCQQKHRPNELTLGKAAWDIAQLTLYRRANRGIGFAGAGNSVNRSSNSGKINTPEFVCHINLSRLVPLKDYNDYVVYL